LILPFASCVGPPIAGMVADKIGNYKLVLMTTVILTGVFHSLLMTVDAHGYPDWVGDNVTAHDLVYINCDESGQTTLEWTNCSDTTCPSAFRKDPVIRFVDSDCYQFCESDTATTCQVGGAGCTPLRAGLVLDLKLVPVKDEKRATKANRCITGIDEMLLANTSKAIQFQCKCSIQCPAMLLNDELQCSKSIPEYDEAKHNRGFWMYLCLRIVATAALGTTFTMMDASAICLIKKHKGELGKQRLCGVVGSSIFGFLSGWMIEWLADGGAKNYAVTFYFADILLFLVVLCFFYLEVEVEKSDGDFFRDVFKLIRLVHIDIFMMMMLLLGTCWGFLEAFLFVFLIELQASSTMLGITVTLGAVVGLPFLYISDIIVKKTGRIVLLLGGFFVYAMRFIGYSFITNPWLSLPFEALEAVTVHLMGISMSLFCASAAPPGLLATLHGMAGSVHYSIGRGVGSFVGGYLISLYGTRNTFRIFGIGATASGIIFVVLYNCFMKPFERASALRRPTIIEPKQPVDFSPLSKTETDMDMDIDEGHEEVSSSRKNSFLAVPGELNAISRRLSF